MVSVASQPLSKPVRGKSFLSFMDMPAEELLAWLLVCGCAFLNLANILVDKDEVGLDLQVLAKLGLIGLGACYGLNGFLTRPRVRKILLSFPVAWLLIILAFYFVAIPFSVSPKFSLVSTCSCVAILLMTVTALDHLGVMKTLNAIFTGMAMFVIGSWLFYFLVPEIGVMAEPIAGGKFVYRMSGLAHPNTLGQYSGLTFVFSVILFFSYRQRSPMILIIGLLALGALISSYSRTSLMACALSLAVGYRHVYLRREYFGFFALGITMLLVGTLMASTQVDLGEKLGSKLELLSKSDDADELTTATGRSEIWAHAIFLLNKQPVAGYGAATQKFFFEDYSLYTHNMLLNIAFSGGVFAGIAALLMMLGRLKSLFFQRHPLADSLAVFIIINGLFENVILSILCGLPTMLWVLCLAWPLLNDDPAVKMLSRSPERPQKTKGYLRLEAA